MSGDPIPRLHGLELLETWDRGESCPVCGIRPPEGVEKDRKTWLAWTEGHFEGHMEAEG